MQKFTTTPFNEEANLGNILNVSIVIEISNNCNLKEGTVLGKEARIVGKAFQLAGFSLPCFFDGDITELDKPDGISNIYMVLPCGVFPIKSRLNQDKVYELELKDVNKSYISSRLVTKSSVCNTQGQRNKDYDVI